MEEKPIVKGSGFTMNPTIDRPIVDRPSSPERMPSTAGMREDRADKLEPLFPRNETEGFRSDWHRIQGDFVDEPKQAVQQADKLVATVIQKLDAEFASQRARLEQGWSKDGEVSTEDLRQSLRRYRAFFDRLLSL